MLHKKKKRGGKGRGKNEKNKSICFSTFFLVLIFLVKV